MVRILDWTKTEHAVYANFKAWGSTNYSQDLKMLIAKHWFKLKKKVLLSIFFQLELFLTQSF